MIANFLAVALHLAWVFLFFALGHSQLSCINVVSVLIFLINIVILRIWGAVLTSVLIGSAEVLSHQFLAIYFLGWGYGFQYFLLVIVAFAFMMNFKTTIIPVAMFFICLISFLGFYYQVQYWNMPHADLGRNVQEYFLMANVTSAFAILAIMSYVYSEAARTAEAKLALEREKSEKLLLNILPVSIAERLKENEAVIADHFESTTVLFSDIVGFTSLSEKISPTELVGRLNHIFSAFDDLVQKYELEKIKTIGDAYMVAGGFPEPKEDHTISVARMALEMLDVLADSKLAAEQPVQIRIGIHCGPAVAGVIGVKKFAYDVWGDTVNTASRMESSGLPGRIQLSQQAAMVLQNQFEIEERGLIDIKGKGGLKTWWLLGERGA